MESSPPKKSMTKVLHIFGSRVETAVIEELGQFHLNDVLEPQRPEELTFSARAAVLAYLMFLMFLKNKGLKRSKLKGVLMVGNNKSTLCPIKKTV